MNKKNDFFVLRENRVSGPFSPSSIKNKIQNGAVGVGDHVGRTESGPWKKLGEVPSLAALIPAEPPARQRPPQFDPVSEPGVPLFLWSIGGAVAVLIVGAVVGGFYLATGDRSGEPADVSAHDARNLRARAEWIGETAVALDLIQTWVKKNTESSGSEGTVTLAGDAEVPGLKDHLTVLRNISGIVGHLRLMPYETVTGEPNVGRECQRLTIFLEAYQLRQKNLVTAVAEFTAADPTTIPYDTLETTIGECRELGVPLLKTRADALARVVAVARDDNAAVARLQKMDGLEFQKATSLRPAVSKGSEPELMALARFFANNKNTDVALADREEVRLENIESIRARNEKSTATRSLYLSNADDYVELGDRHGSRTVVNWHSKSPTYFTPVVPGDEKSFRKIADSLGLSLKGSSPILMGVFSTV